MIKGENVYLRALEPADLKFLYQAENDREIWRVSNTTTPFSKQVLKNYIESVQDIYTDKQLRLIICRKSDSEPLGMIDLFDFEARHEKAGVGIWIVSAAERKKGFAEESLRLVIDYAFNTLFLHQLYCGVLKNNEASINLFEKCGFLQTGTKKDWVKTPSGWEDEIQYQLINTGE
ncbi:GNAT family N-acetyltransferase [Halocola ammonii]